MNKTKKIIILLFTVTLVINLQLNGSITQNMDNGFSLVQLADNIFAPSVFADEIDVKCADIGCPGGNYYCKHFTTPSGHIAICMQEIEIPRDF